MLGIRIYIIVTENRNNNIIELEPDIGAGGRVSIHHIHPLYIQLNHFKICGLINRNLNELFSHT